MSLRLPRRMWSTQYFQNAKQNTHKLTSHIDTYKTLKQFLYFNKYKKLLEEPFKSQVGKCRRYFSKSDPETRSLRGVSLFENIETTRTCSEAMIPFVYCNCNRFVDLTEDEKSFTKESGATFKEAVKLVLKELNAIAENFRDQCEPFRFESIKSVHGLVHNSERIFKLSFLTTPGQAEFKSIVKIFNSSSIKFVSKIIRTSIYGRQSDCMKEQRLYGFCFCK